MKRDDWKLEGGIRAGDDAWLLDGDENTPEVERNKLLCHVIKVRGSTIRGFEEGNVLIEVQGELKAVYGSQLRPITE